MLSLAALAGTINELTAETKTGRGVYFWFDKGRESAGTAQARAANEAIKLR